MNDLLAGFTIASLLIASEWIAAMLGLGGVLLGLSQRRGVWPLWMASSAIYCGIYLWYALYGQALLMLVFMGMSVWGLRSWAQETAEMRLRPLSVQEGLIGLGLALVGWFALGSWLEGTESPSPWLDAAVTMASLWAMRLMARKQLACWPAWALANGLSVWLFASQALWATTLLYLIQLGLSGLGYLRWRRADDAQ